MKICPRCQKTYADDNLNFCLEDGSVLTQASGAGPPSYGGQQIPPTNPQASIPGQGQPQWNVQQQPNYGMQQQPQKKSRAWIWVLLILGAVILLCGGGVVGLFIYGTQQANQLANTLANAANTAANSSNRSTTSSNSSSLTTSGRTKVKKIDLAPWVKPVQVYGTTEFTNGELIIGSKQKLYYYVLCAPDENDYRTDDADVQVTVRNLNDGVSSMGYGLVFHSSPTPLQQDYAFLIDTKKKKFRVVHHTPAEEKIDVPWTASAAIKGGTEENVLEVHDLTDKIELYINGTMVKSITNTYGYEGGVAGLYSGDGIKVAFKDMEVRK